jgi:hypothetical protein
MKPRKALLLLAAAGLAVAAGEGGLRALGLARPDPFTYVGEHENRPSENFVPDPLTGWRMRPSHSFHWEVEGRPILYRSDAEGFRTASEGAPPSGEKRLVVAGDSFAWGTGVAYEETFAARLARDLGGWSLLNLAMPGYGLDQIWLSVRHVGIPADPGLVVVAIYAEDLERCRRAFRTKEGFNKPVFKLDAGALVSRTSLDRPSSLVRWLENHSRLFTAWRGLVRRAGRYVPFGEWWSLNEAILDAIRADCAAAGVPVLFVHVPPKDWRSFPTLARYMRRAGADYVDPVAIRSDPPDGAYSGVDSHLSAPGHRLFAQWILERVDQR